MSRLRAWAATGTTHAMSRGRILIVDDEHNARTALGEILSEEGFETREAEDGLAALEILEHFEPDVVLTDLKMPRLDGIGLIERAKESLPHTVFVVMTAFATIETAVRAIQLGADNYLTKPLHPDAVSAIANRALETARLRAETTRLRAQVGQRLSVRGIVGDHPSMQRVFEVIAQVARSKATVLISGETGTGKELIAAAVHHASKRRDGPFVKVNCAALAEGVLESELFGHERGAFTGATGRRAGRFEQAHGGTLFLDEVSEIPTSTQVKLLRFLQEREFERVGGNDSVAVDVRIVTATNRDLKVAVKEGTFREDLYYRLDVVRIPLPPLRARRSDVPLLAQHFLDRVCEENELELEGFTDDALRKLQTYPWPGNVRELENAVERAAVLCRQSKITADLLPGSSSATTETSEEDLDLLVPGISMNEIERIAIQRTLEATGGSTAKAAEMLGLSRRKIQYRLKEWSADPEDEEE